LGFEPIQFVRRSRYTCEVCKADGKVCCCSPCQWLYGFSGTTGQSYSAEVDQFVNDPSVIDELGPTEEQAVKTVKETVDTIEIKTNKCRALERAIQATLETRGCKITGGGAEWFRASRDDILAIYEFINKASA